MSKNKLRQGNAIPKPNQITINLPIGPAGMPEYLSLVSGNDAGPLYDPKGSKGKYVVLLTLSRPGIKLHYLNDDSQDYVHNGDSFIAIAKPAVTPLGDADTNAIEMVDSADNIIFKGYSNERGFLSSLEVQEFDADSFSDAIVKAYAKVAPAISRWSVHLDLPINITRTEILELKSRSRMVSLENSYPEITFSAAPCGHNDDKTFEAIASLYREALNSNSYAYQFLCFYKIYEALNGRRTRDRKKAEKEGLTYNAPAEAIPENEQECAKWLEPLFPLPAPGAGNMRTMYFETYLPSDSRGKSFAQLLCPDSGEKRGDLTKVRDLIAHALTSPSQGEPYEIVNFDDQLLRRRVNHWLPLMKVVIRKMLLTDFPDTFLSNKPNPTRTASC